VEDLKSTNGTHVNGAPVAGVAALAYGDEVRIGDVRLRLERGRG
jgi:pSer/pThr/pTyr-binding forkhead associated (FHA) protein